MNNLLDVLTREGVLINVSVRYWRGCKKLRPEDLGLEAEAVSNRLISLGHKRLLPKEATADLALIEGRAHALIDTNTFPFLNGLGHFLPNTRLADITDKLRALEAEFWRAQEDFVAHYDRHRQSAMEEWQTVAAKLVPDPAQLVATIASAFPLALEKHFGFDTTLFQIAVPEQLTTDLITLAEQQQIVAARQQAAQQAGVKIRGDVENFVAECVASLREQTATLCEEMLQSISDGKTDGVHQKTLNRLTRFIDQFQQMNFANDPQNHDRGPQTRAHGPAQGAAGRLGQTRDRRCVMKRSIEVTVSPMGDILIDAVGFKGADCEKATRFLEEALGVAGPKQKKPEYHQRGRTAQTQKLGS